jgi:DNA-binding NtrC family response regulator
VLIVDDDEQFARTMGLVLEEHGFDVTCTHTVADGRRLLADSAPDLLLLDVILPDGSGLELIEDVTPDSATRIVVVTAQPSISSAVTALRSRVHDYLIKPFNIDKLQTCLERLDRSPRDIRPASAKRSRKTARGIADHTSEPEGLVGESKDMKRVFSLIGKVARTKTTVLIQGESGTGKEMVAAAIARMSGRDDPFLAVNCGAISPTLIASELFGHEQGAFTGATRQHKGHFERAHGGTLFLDEVTELPLELQANLLRVIETGRIMRVGGTGEVAVDVRLIAATNRDPAAAVAEGALREDLYFRLRVFPIRLPALRERHEDIGLLAEHFLGLINKEHGRSKQLTDEALQQLMSHPWPGNVRELRNAVEQAYILADDLLRPEHFAAWLAEPLEIRRNSLQFDVGTPIEEAERRLLFATLEHFDGDKKKTAATLGVSLKTLYNRLKAYEGKR